MRRGIARTVARVLRARPGLLVFPALSAGTMALVTAAAWALPLNDAWRRVRAGHAPSDAQGAAFVVMVALLSCVGTYYTAALLHSVHLLEAGERPAFRVSLGAALRRLPVLAAWSLLSSTVGLLFRGLESTAGLSIVFESAGFSWSLLTFFVLPVLMVERAGLLASLRRSLALGRRELGNWVAGGVRLFLTTALVLIVSLVALILAAESESYTVLFATLGSVVALWLLTGLVTATASGIYRMTLYRQAAERG